MQKISKFELKRKEYRSFDCRIEYRRENIISRLFLSSSVLEQKGTACSLSSGIFSVTSTTLSVFYFGTVCSPSQRTLSSNPLARTLRLLMWDCERRLFFFFSSPFLSSPIRFTGAKITLLILSQPSLLYLVAPSHLVPTHTFRTSLQTISRSASWTQST